MIPIEKIMSMVASISQQQLNIYKQNPWGAKTANFIKGCRNDCRYCFSKAYSIRVGRKTIENWKDEVINPDYQNIIVKYFEGGFMFPQTHDISPQCINENVFMLKKILEVGNDVFCVTKPHLECIERICNEFSGYRKQLHFCFTIGSTDSNTLKFWEPGATDFNDRLACLKLAFSLGFKTSVSAEPLLDRNIDDLVEKLTPYITNHIWFGKMNNPKQGLGMNGYSDDFETVERVKDLIIFQNDRDFILHYYHKYIENPKIEWKENFSDIILNDSSRSC